MIYVFFFSLKYQKFLLKNQKEFILLTKKIILRNHATSHQFILQIPRSKLSFGNR